MAGIRLTQPQANALIEMKVHRSSDEHVDFPLGGQSAVLSLQSADGREQFLLDSRGLVLGWKVPDQLGRPQLRTSRLVFTGRVDDRPS